MPLSRHFYSIDEIRSALSWTASRNNIKESLFWCKELIDSGCAAELISTLFETWIWHFGPTRMQWLNSAWKLLASDELCVDDIILSTYQLASIPAPFKDSSLWNILAITGNCKEIPDRVTMKTPTNWLDTSNILETTFIRAIYQGKGCTAWWLVQYIECERFWELILWYVANVKTSREYTLYVDALRGYENLLGYSSKQYDVIIKCLAVLSLSIWSEEKSFANLPGIIENSYIAYMNDLEKLIGRRARRKYPIPKLSLYGITPRGCMQRSQKNMNELYSCERSLIGCPFWDEALSQYADIGNGKIIWNSDDAMEEFYNIYFPDDIPDEWGLKDQEMSHGEGLLSSEEGVPNIGKYCEIFFSNKSRLVWGGSMLDHLKKIVIDDCDITKIANTYEAGPLIHEQLQPVHKVKVII